MNCAFMLADEYEMWEYEPIPYLRLGYNSLLNLIQSIKDIKVSKNSEGESVFVLKERKNKDFDDYARNQSFKPKIKVHFSSSSKKNLNNLFIPKDAF